MNSSMSRNYKIKMTLTNSLQIALSFMSFLNDSAYITIRLRISYKRNVCHSVTFKNNGMHYWGIHMRKPFPLEGTRVSF